MIRNRDLAKHLAKETWMTQVEATQIINVIFDKIKKELLNGSDISIYELCTLWVKEAMGRTVVVPTTGILMEAKPYKKVWCRFSVKFRNLIKQS